MAQTCRVIQMKLKHLVQENVHMITDLLVATIKAYLSAITVTNISQTFTYKMAAKINWHRYETKLRHSPSYV